MAVKKTYRQLFQELEKLVGKQQPRVRKAFLDAMLALRGAPFGRVATAIATGDLDKVLAVLQLDVGVLNTYQQILTETFTAAGSATSAAIPPPPASPHIVFRFDMQAVGAEAWGRQYMAHQVTNMIDEQKAIVRQTILSGFTQGQHPHSIARTLLGGPTKQGGVIGLSAPQHTYVANMRSRLASGDPVEMQKILDGMTLRDRSFDKTIRQYMAAGKPVPEALIQKMTARYSARLLDRRAKDIARTETGAAVMSSRMEAVKQALGKTNYPDDAVTKKWRHGGGGKDPRIEHENMSNQSVRGLHTPFLVGNRKGGFDAMQHPLDTKAPVAQIANCTCDMEINIDYAWGLTNNGWAGGT